jgi:8-oxo-dGTP pyrophosphatase MutT (NUDIX family)
VCVLFNEVVSRLRTALREPLPGAAAQAFMAPVQARPWPPGFNPRDARAAAGLLLLVAHENRAHVVLTVRAEGLGRHRGQVSLPGGVVDAGETYEQAAFREAREEIGLEPHGVETLGALTPLEIPVSGFRLHPIVGSIVTRPTLRPAQAEVARIIEAPIEELLDPDRTAWRTMTREGRALDFPAFPAGDVDIWGATAMVLAELLALLGWRGPNRP